LGTITEWFYTAPLEDFAVRRGDPLGMRHVAEEIAELLAPGLSNRTMDARWLSIMCWALEHAHPAWRKFGAAPDDGTVASRDAARSLYTWIRPLELLWIARTFKATSDQAAERRQLPGVQAVRRWVEGGATEARFGMFPESYARYRFTGVYGAYRVALRSLSGLTLGADGWRLDSHGKALAEIVHGSVWMKPTQSIGARRRLLPEEHWLERFEWHRGRGTPPRLPTVLNDPRRLPADESRVLAQSLFPSVAGDENGRRRRNVLEAAAASRATTRPALYGDIARRLAGEPATERLRHWSAFSELADAGIAAMNACWSAAGKGGENGVGSGAMTIDGVLAHSDVVHALDELGRAAKRWKKEGTSAGSFFVVDALAGGIVAAGADRRRRLKALERHHATYGGGLRWLMFSGNELKLLAPSRGGEASNYRVRIEALSRLGVQCGVIKCIPDALLGADAFDPDGAM